MALTEAQKKKIEEEEVYRRELREREQYRNRHSSGNNRRWYKKKRYWLLLFLFSPLLISLMLATELLPMLIGIGIAWYIWKKTQINRSKKYLFASVAIGSGLLLNIIGGTYINQARPQPLVPTPTPTSTPASASISIDADDLCILQAHIALSTTQLEVTNLSNQDWDSIITVYSGGGLFSGGYKFKTAIPAGQKITAGLALFVDGKGNRFNPYQKAVHEVNVFDKSSICDYYAQTK